MIKNPIPKQQNFSSFLDDADKQISRKKRWQKLEELYQMRSKIFYWIGAGAWAVIIAFLYGAALVSQGGGILGGIFVTALFAGFIFSGLHVFTKENDK